MAAKGYTLIEVILVLGIISIMFAIAGVLVSDLIPKANITTVTTTLLGDLRQQQLKAMTGETGDGSAGARGIWFGSDTYVLFEGTAYDANDPDNLVVELEENSQVSSTFGSEVLVFAPTTGEINNFVAGSDSITVSDPAGTTSYTIVLNELGVPTQTQ